MLRDERAEGTDPVWQIFVQDGDTGRQKPTEGHEGNSGAGQRKSYQRAPAANGRAGRAGRAARDHQAPLDRDRRDDDMDMPMPEEMR